MRRALAALLFAACACHREKAAALPDLAAQQSHDALKKRFDALAARDPVLAIAQRDPSDVVVATRPALVEALLQETARRYLDRVVLDLTPDHAKFHEEREVEVDTFLGHMKAGSWRVDVDVQRVHGVLEAGEPSLTPERGNRLAVRQPVKIREGRVSAQVRFEWDARSVAGAVCGDFTVARTLEGEVMPDAYVVDGAFDLSAGADALRADPDFPPHKFRLRVDLTAASWKVVDDALEEQNHLLKCGIGLHPDLIEAKLRDVLHKGFDVKLPRSLFRPLDFPAGVRRSVQLEDHALDLQVQTHALSVTPDALWYGADVRSALRLAAAPSPSPSAAGPSPSAAGPSPPAGR
jgi:hypothetical protein